MEKQCWTDAQYSRIECMETVGIPSSVHRNQLEDFDKLNYNVVEDNIEDRHRD